MNCHNNHILMKETYFMPTENSMKSITHNKVKNTGIIFELLARQLTSDILNGIAESKCLAIIQEHFRPSSEIGKELALYRAFFNTTSLSETKALKFIDLIIEQRKRLNEKKLNREKYELIKDIKENYQLDAFLSSKIPNYKVYASIYKTFLSEMAIDIDFSDITDITNCRFTIAEHLSQTAKRDDKDEKNADSINNTIFEEYRQLDPEVRNYAYTILLKRFNEKYNNLSESQKLLLKNYITASPASNVLREYVNTEVPKVKDTLTVSLKKVNDKVTQIKLNEAIAQLDNITHGKVVKDNHITSLMIAYQLINEINELEN